MPKRVLITLAVVIALVLVAVVLVLGSTGNNATTETPVAPTSPVGQTPPPDTTGQPEPTAPPTSTDPGKFVDYDSALLANADDGDVVLFFWAAWCPTCRALESSLNADLADIPSNLTILRTNYDTESALKQKYGVTYQHTLVQVDSQGNQLKKWSGSYSLAEIQSQLI